MISAYSPTDGTGQEKVWATIWEAFSPVVTGVSAGMAGEVGLAFGFGELLDGVAEGDAGHRPVAGRFRVKPGMRESRPGMRV